MSRLNVLLAGLLLTQLALGIGLFLQQDGADRAPATSLLSFTPGEVKLLTVSESEASLSLRRADQEWRLPNDAIADANRVNKLLDKLAELEGGWPVANTAGSHTRFEVAADKHQKRVTLASDEGEVTLYIGTAPDFRKVHVRAADSDDVYAVNLSSFELPVSELDWLPADTSEAVVDGVESPAPAL